MKTILLIAMLLMLSACATTREYATAEPRKMYVKPAMNVAVANAELEHCIQVSRSLQLTVDECMVARGYNIKMVWPQDE